MKKTRIFFYISIAVLLIVICIWGYTALVNPIRFPVATVRVTGNYPHISQNELQITILPYAQQGLFGFPARKLQNELEQIPWIDNVNIRRIWPDVMALIVTEKEPIATWNNSALLTSNGILFSPNKKTFPDDLPKLYGPDDKAVTMLKAFIRMDMQLAKLNLSIQEFDMSARHSWKLTLNNMIKVLVGKDDAEQRMQQFVVLYPQIIGDKDKKVISVDLRYANGVAIMWKK